VSEAVVEDERSEDPSSLDALFLGIVEEEEGVKEAIAGSREGTKG
jgi:hypothetical protein